MKKYYAIKFNTDFYMTESTALACKAHKFYDVYNIVPDPKKLVTADLSNENEYYITDELNEEHAFTWKYLLDKGVLYISIDADMRTWWNCKSDTIYHLHNTDVELAVTKSLNMKTWCVLRAREGLSAKIVGDGFDSLEDAIEHGDHIYYEIKRIEIQDRLNEMLEVIKASDDKINIVEIDNNFTERKTGGLLLKEIECLNEIWDRWKNN